MLELSSERPKFMTGPQSPLAGRQYVAPSELAGQTIFRIEGSVGESPNQARADYLDQLGLGANPVQQVKTFLEASILVQAGLGIAPLPEGMERNLSRDVSVFSIEGTLPDPHRGAAAAALGESLAGDHFFQLIRRTKPRSGKRLQTQ